MELPASVPDLHSVPELQLYFIVFPFLFVLNCDELASQDDLQNLVVPPYTFTPMDFSMYDVVVAADEAFACEVLIFPGFCLHCESLAL